MTPKNELSRATHRRDTIDPRRGDRVTTYRSGRVPSMRTRRNDKSALLTTLLKARVLCVPRGILWKRLNVCNGALTVTQHFSSVLRTILRDDFTHRYEIPESKAITAATDAAAHGLSQLQRSHQCVAGPLRTIRISKGVGNALTIRGRRPVAALNCPPAEINPFDDFVDIKGPATLLFDISNRIYESRHGGAGAPNKYAQSRIPIGATLRTKFVLLNPAPRLYVVPNGHNGLVAVF
ncbi:hypothetical protein EVAR_63869_1, partial [Eumeta japonica]